MSVLVVGISHKTAPVSVLERVALDADGATKLVRDVSDLEHVTEATVLSTCNRTEVYTDVDRFHGSVETISRMFGELAGQSPEDVLSPPLRALRRRRRLAPVPRRRRPRLDGARGEPDPRPDPRGAADGPGARHGRPRPQRAVPAGPARRQALARRDRHRPGRAQPGVLRARPRRRARRRPRRQARRHRRRRLDGRPDRGHGLPRRCRARSRSPTGRPSGPPASPSSTTPRRSRSPGSPTSTGPVDVLVSCTGATGVLIDFDAVAARRRDEQPLAVVDLALPRDVDPDVAHIPGVRLIALDTLAAELEDAPGAGDVEGVRTIVAQELSAFLAARRSQSVTPTVVALRTMATGVVEAELARLMARMPDLDDTSRAEVEKTLRRVAEKLLHQPDRARQGARQRLRRGLLRRRPGRAVRARPRGRRGRHQGRGGHVTGRTIRIGTRASALARTQSQHGRRCPDGCHRAAPPSWSTSAPRATSPPRRWPRSAAPASS